MVTFDCHRPGSTIVSLDITPDWRTACATSLPVAFLRLTSGPLLQAVSAPTQAITQTAYFILVSPQRGALHRSSGSTICVRNGDSNPHQPGRAGDGGLRPPQARASGEGGRRQALHHRLGLRARGRPADGDQGADRG